MRTGFYVPFSETLDPQRSTQALSAVRTMLEHPLMGVTDIIPGYLNVLFEFDSSQVTEKEVRAWARDHFERLPSQDAPRVVEIPVRYDGEDLEWVAEQTGLTQAEVIRLHAGLEYHAFAVGFTPGFPFLGVLDQRLQLPRRAQPRARVPAHSVAIALRQTGVYPSSSPGGWHLIGSAGVAMYDPHRQPAFWVRPGDRVRFTPTASLEVPAVTSRLELWPLEPRLPALKVEEPGLMTLLVNSPRRFVGHLGLAQSGALDARSAARANAVVGNAPDAPLLELTLTGGIFTALRDVVLGFAGYGMKPMLEGQFVSGASSFAVRAGQTVRFKPIEFGARAYFSIAGGFEVKRAWGSASVDFRADLGRALMAGDVFGLEVERAVRPGFTLPQPTLEAQPIIRLQPGPQASFEALRALHGARYTFERGDRMGLQFAGTQVPTREISSEATPLGAVQVTSGGQPIVLLHDRGRIGGYSKPAIVHPGDLWRFAQLRPGQSVRFWCISDP
jgi:KipI family sensor histidine kinase inhibitor